MRVVLVMFREGGEQRSFSLTRDVTVVGRREDADFRIPLTDVSRKHCRITRDAKGLKVEDLGSSNGTFVNGQKIQSARLVAGDRLQIGPVPFVVQIDGNPNESSISSDASPAGTAAAAVASAHHAQPGEFDPMDALIDPNASGGFDIIDTDDATVDDDDVIIDLGHHDEK